MLLDKIRSLFKGYTDRIISENRKEIELNRMLLAKQLLKTADRSAFSSNIQEHEFKVFSQWGDDGIIQFLIRNITISTPFFVEFGVENYLEANTRFLLQNNNWSGLVMDGSENNIDQIRKDPISWRYDLHAKAAFITAENIDHLLLEASVKGNIGILHIDIDGNDYWVWKAISVIQADIVIVEYNSVFGNERSITVPYMPDFERTKAHYSNLLYGSSLCSLCDLAEVKGYYFIGCNSAGNNAYFVRKEKIGQLKPISAKEGFVDAKFRESRSKEGELSFLSGTKKTDELKNLQVFNTRTHSLETF